VQASDWTRTILPHCLSKINRVAYGMLTPADLAAIDPLTPESRKLLAVPFIGKDVPSRSSEFAHPDVLMGCVCNSIFVLLVGLHQHVCSSCA
jgi:hypothetical protein